MADDVKVRIATTFDPKGTNEAKKGLEGVAKGAKQTSDAAQGAAQSLSALGGAVSLVNPQLGGMISMTASLTTGVKGLGLALKALMTNPIVIAIAAAAAAFMLWRKAVDEAKEAWDRYYASVQKGISDTIRDRNRDTARSLREVADAAEDAADRMQHLNEVEGVRRDNARALEDAEAEMRRQGALAGAGTEAERRAVEDAAARERIETERRRAAEDVRAGADAAWNPALAANAARNVAALRARLANEGREETGYANAKRNAEVAERRYKRQGREEDVRRAREEADAYGERVKDAADRQAATRSEIAKAEREAAQGQERRAEILKRLAAVEREALAKQIALNESIRRRDEEIRRRDEDGRRARAERDAEAARRNAGAFDEADEADREALWKRLYDREDAAGRRAMAEDRRGRAAEDEDAARKSMERLADALEGETDERRRAEIARGLDEARGDFGRASARRREAEGLLADMDAKDGRGPTGALRAEDRISAVGGFSSAGAAAVTGVGVAGREKAAVERIAAQVERIGGKLDEINGGVRGAGVPRWA